MKIERQVINDAYLIQGISCELTVFWRRREFPLRPGPVVSQG